MPLFSVSFASCGCQAAAARHMSLPFAWGKLVWPQRLQQHHVHIYGGTLRAQAALRDPSRGDSPACFIWVRSKARACGCHLEMYMRYNRKYEGEYVVKLNSINNKVIWICEMNSLGQKLKANKVTVDTWVLQWRGFNKIAKLLEVTKQNKFFKLSIATGHGY